jgi:hypothetical protein
LSIDDLCESGTKGDLLRMSMNVRMRLLSTNASSSQQNANGDPSHLPFFLSVFLQRALSLLALLESVLIELRIS